MSVDTDLTIQPLIERYQQLIKVSRSIMLSTYSEKFGPEISYAPFVKDERNLYIFVSELARHTANMLATKQAAIMFIQAEQEANDIFARERVTYQCRVEEVPASEDLYRMQLQAMEEKLGETVMVLRSLKDFHLLKLTPVSGQFIAGFGKAFHIDVDKGILSRFVV